MITIISFELGPNLPISSASNCNLPAGERVVPEEAGGREDGGGGGEGQARGRGRQEEAQGELRDRADDDMFGIVIGVTLCGPLKLSALWVTPLWAACQKSWW
jgi:hypothetical protein